MSAPAKGKRRFWTEADLTLLRQMTAAGEGYRAMSAALNRTHGSINTMMRTLGLNIDPAMAARRREEANKARTGEKRGKRPCSPEQRARLRSYCEKMNSDPAIRADAIEKMRQWKRSPEGREQCRRAREKQLAPSFGHWPPACREIYRDLTRHKGLPAAEARAIVEAEIERIKGREQRARTDELRRRAEAMRTGGGRARISAPLREADAC